MMLRMRKFGAACLAGAAMATGSAALADQVVMPYRCEAFGREINLTPSQPHTYDIYGRREQDIVTACAPDDPGRCRTWRIHRFEMNCGGARVPWIDVVDAANASNRGPARVRNGRLYVRMDPWWARRRVPAWAERPKLREFDEGELRPGNFRYQPSARAPSVEMPPGFAPIIGLDARFVDSAPVASDGSQGRDSAADANGGRSPAEWNAKTADNRGAGSAGTALPPIAVAPPVQKSAQLAKPVVAAKDEAPVGTPSATAGKTSTRDPGHTFAPKAAEAKPIELKPAEAKPLDEKADDKKIAAASEAVSGVSAPTAPATATQPTVPPAPVANVPITSVPGTSTTEPTINSVAPTILNHPGAETKAITSASSSSGDKAGTDVAASEAAMPATLETGANPPPLFTPSAPQSWPIIMGVSALVLLATAMAFFLRRQNEQRLSPNAAARDFSSVSLDAVQSRALVRAAPPEPALSAGPPEPQPASHPLSLAHALAAVPSPVEPFIAGPVIEPEWLPTTREEALQVLGAGPDASDAVIKKIVDGLRMSWHPDHAKSAEDHRMRSERMTQINVAWDILAGRQAEIHRQI